MGFLSAKDQSEIKRLFENLSGDVRLIFFTQRESPLVIPGQECDGNLASLSQGVQVIGQREFLIRAGIEMWKDSPIIGYGLESFVKYSPVFFPLEPRGTKAHNIYIMFYFEAGILGLMAFTWLMGRICLWIVQRWRVNQRLAIMAGATVVTFMAECYSDNIFDYVSYDWCFWFGFGLMLAPLAQALPPDAVRLVSA